MGRVLAKGHKCKFHDFKTQVDFAIPKICRKSLYHFRRNRIVKNAWCMPKSKDVHGLFLDFETARLRLHCQCSLNIMFNEPIGKIVQAAYLSSPPLNYSETLPM